MSKAFSDFMHSNYSGFVMYACARGQLHVHADEIVDEAFVRLWERWDERESCGESSNRKWMYNTIEYIIQERCRREKRHSHCNLDEVEEILSDNSMVDEKLTYSEFLSSIMARLSESDGELFMLAFVEEFDYREICARLSITSPALRVRISRLRVRVAKIIDELEAKW